MYKDIDFYQSIPSSQLEASEIHLWKTNLSDFYSKFREFKNIISENERLRANRFVFEKDYKRFITRRGILRILLREYVGDKPGALKFSVNEYGKPDLVHISDKNQVQFNVSQSDDLFLTAITRNRKIGVDVEKIRLDNSFWDVAEQYYYTNEYIFLQSFPRELQPSLFYTMWCCKEAAIKAAGLGLSESMPELKIRSSSTDLKKLYFEITPSFSSLRWSLFYFCPAPNYVGALAVEAGESNIIGFSKIPVL